MMKFKTLICIISLLSLCLSTTSVVWGQSTQALYAKVLFASGYIEFKSANSDSWEFVTTGMPLNTADLIRMPPATLLRIQWGEERIKFKGCQEDTVSHLIEKFRTTANKPEPLSQSIVHDTNDEASAPREKRMRDSKSNVTKPSAQTLNKIATPGAHIREYVAKLIEQKSFHSDEYPYRNLGIASFLYNNLAEHQIKERPLSQEVQNPWTTLSSGKGNDMDYAALYCALLKAAGINNASFQEKEDKRFLLLDTGIREPGRLTANHHLYRKKQNTIWLPLQITRSETSFVRSWYHGKEAPTLEAK